MKTVVAYSISQAQRDELIIEGDDIELVPIFPSLLQLLLYFKRKCKVPEPLEQQ